MELKQLTALVTVAEAGSVTKAAERLHLVQPAVTRQIQMLEEELGVPLFVRSRQGMRTTDAGAVMVERARRALIELERARAELRQRESGPVTGIVTIGLLESVIDLIAARLVARMKTAHPKVDLRVMTAYSGHLQQWLDQGDLDLSLLYNLSSSPSIHVVPLLEEQLWATATTEAGLSPDSPVTWQELCSQPLVLPVSGHGLRALIDQALPRPNPEIRIAVETNSLALQKKFVAGGHGWTVLPAAGIAQDIAHGHLSGAPISDPALSRQVVLGLPLTARTPPAVEAVAGVLLGLVDTLVRSGEWPSAQPLDWNASLPRERHS